MVVATEMLVEGLVKNSDSKDRIVTRSGDVNGKDRARAPFFKERIKSL